MQERLLETFIYTQDAKRFTCLKVGCAEKSIKFAFVKDIDRHIHVRVMTIYQYAVTKYYDI